MWRDFFYFSKREKQGIILLAVLILGIFLGRYFFSPKNPEPLEESQSVERDTTIIKTDSSLKEEKQPATSNFSNQKTNQSRTNQTSQSESRTYYVRKNDTLTRPTQKEYIQSEKLQAGTVLELNSVDTTELKKIPGIGSGYANRIVKYRELLGGFYSVEQLQEVYGMYEELYDKIAPFLTVNAEAIDRLPINDLSLERLRKHPYINFYQAKAIVELRKKKGKISDMQELKLFEEFSKEDWARLEFYLGL